MPYYVIPPEHNAEFVAAMEHVLKVYEMPHDSEVPVVTMDEQPVQLFRETRTPIGATRNHAKRVDSEYERAGVASVFMFTSPLGHWRRYAMKNSKAFNGTSTSKRQEQN